MDRKSVLVSYGERNKVVSIPQSTGKSDLEFLSKEFKTVFSFGDNVNLLLTFQKFDSEWGEYLDLENNSTLFHKDKVNAIVTPILTDDTPLPSVVPSEVAATNTSEVSSVVPGILWLCM